MAKSAKRTYSAYSSDAMNLPGATIRVERKTKKMSQQELAERAGVARSVIQRVEKGDMTCGIGIVFEVAHIAGIPLFDAEPSRLSSYEPELPLKSGTLSPLTGLNVPNCIRDASPDAWGRRVILNRLQGNVDENELTYLLESGSDRIGALDFQASPTEYVPRQSQGASFQTIRRYCKGNFHTSKDGYRRKLGYGMR